MKPVAIFLLRALIILAVMPLAFCFAFAPLSWLGSLLGLELFFGILGIGAGLANAILATAWLIQLWWFPQKECADADVP